MFFIRQNATHKVVLGPCVAVGDGFTPVTTLALGTADEAEAILHDNGTVVDISAYTFAAITTADGYYHLTLQSGISGTIGHLTIVINDDSLCLPLKADFQVIEEAAYDAMYASGAAGPLQPTVAGRTLDVTAGGAAGIDWGNVENQTGTVDLDNTTLNLVYFLDAFSVGIKRASGFVVDGATISTVTSQTVFEIDIGSTDDGALVGHMCLITDQSTGTQKSARMITAYTGATREITLESAPDFTIATSDLVDVRVSVGRTLTAIQGATFDTSTDSLEAIRDRGDAAWTTGAGGTPPQLLQSTTIATLASQVSFTLTAGSADDNAYNGAMAIITDSATSTQKAFAAVQGYVGATKTVTLLKDPAVFTMAVGDTIDIVAMDLLERYNLNHLMIEQAVDGDFEDGSALSQMVDTGQSWASFTPTQDSLRALRAAIDARPAASAIADAVWDEDATPHQSQGTFGQAIGDPVGDADTIYGAVVTGAAGANIAADLVAVDTVVDAIKVKTDQMVFSKANELDANTKSINDAGVVGDGNATPWDGA